METPPHAVPPAESNAALGLRLSVLLRPPSGGKDARFFAVLCGNPRLGKTTLFNALTGLRARVGGSAGVTVEHKEGRLSGGPPDLAITMLDLPGTYSLSPQSLDEQICRDVLLHRLAEVPAPELKYLRRQLPIRSGDVSEVSAPLSVAISGTPSITSFSPDSGEVGDGITNATQLTLTGTGEANSTVQVYDGAALLGAVSVNASGAWSFATATSRRGPRFYGN